MSRRNDEDGLRIASPIFKAAGGKTQLLPKLLPYVPEKIGTYYEPFVGGAALFFALAPRLRRAVLGDANERMMRTYMGVRDEVDEVIRLLGRMRYEKKFYYRQRKRNPETMDEAEVAAWFIYMNKCGFNGLYRVNKQGGFNVPFGKYTNPTICDEPGLRACSAILRKTRANLRTTDFEKTVRSAERRDFVYFDPPYVPISDTANFTAYTVDGFGHEDQVRLRDTAVALKKRGVVVVLSNHDVPIVRKLYKGFKFERVKAKRNINSKASKRGPVWEVIIT